VTPDDKPRLKGKPATAHKVKIRGFLEHIGSDAWAWHPDYQLPESADYQFRLNLVNGFYKDKRLVGYWGRYLNKYTAA